MRPGLLALMLDDLLEVAVDVLTPDPLDPDDPRTAPPDRQIVAHGPGAFAWDCPMVAASMLGLSFETQTPTGAPAGCSVVPVARLVATVLRCVPTVDGAGIPEAAEVTASGSELAVDGWALAAGIAAAWSDGSLFTSSGIGCGRVTLGPLDPLGPLGGLGGWQLEVAVRF